MTPRPEHCASWSHTVHISALVKNARGSCDVAVTTGDSRKTLAIPCRESGFGSEINGGGLLMLALATCYCNDLCREAARLGMGIESVEVGSAGQDFACADGGRCHRRCDGSAMGRRRDGEMRRGRTLAV